MSLTPFGIVILIFGFGLLVTASLRAMFAFLLICSLFGGAAAVNLPALGGSSIPPVHFALGFLVLRYLLPGTSHGPLVRISVRQNLPLVIFVLYATSLSYIGPRLFAGKIDVVPMHIAGFQLFGMSPLQPSSQNITAAIYLVGTLLCAIGAYVAGRNEGGARTLVGAGLVVAALHIGFGVASVVLKDTPLFGIIDFFRNAAYAQTDQRLGTVIRMTGVQSEPSSYASFGIGWFVFVFECWYRNVASRWSGPLSFLLALALLASTSSTAYLGLGCYSCIFLARLLVFPSGAPADKLAILVISCLLISAAVSAMLIIDPDLIDKGVAILTNMTVNKRSSESGMQRAFWVKQGIENFYQSYGFGIGPGSFRSSSFLSAILGSVGFVGLITLLAYLLKVMKFDRSGTYNRALQADAAVGVAASWAAFNILLTACFVSASADPGTDFAVMAGVSLALRRQERIKALRTYSLERSARPPCNAPIMATPALADVRRAAVQALLAPAARQEE